MTQAPSGMRRLFRLALAATCLVAAPLWAAPAEAPAAAYRLGIFPYMAPRQTVDFFGPVAASMEAALKHPVRLESVPTFADFTRAMAARSYDIALIQPFDYPEVVERGGYLPLAQLSAPLVSQFYVRDDSPHRKIEDLRGTIVAMPPAQSPTARMTLRALQDNKLVPGRDVEVRYFSSHDSCIQQVWVGSASACGTARPPTQIFEQRMQARLRAIHDTPPVPHVVFVAHPRVPAEHRARLQERIIGWSQAEDGRALLKSLGFQGFVAHRPADYAIMRSYEPAAAVVQAVPAAGKELVLGVLPIVAPRQLALDFAPVLPALARSVGMPVHLRTAASFGSFSDTLVAATYDIVMVQPFDYAKAASHGYLPLAGMKEGLQGTFFVLEQSPYQKIHDLRGKVIAMPPADAAVSRLGRHALLQAGLTPGRDVTIDYRNKPESCLHEVRSGAAAACVATGRIRTSMPEEMSRGFRTFGQTEKVPGILFMAHERLAVKTREQLQAQIVSWKDSDEGRKILQSIRLGELVPVNAADYQNMPKFEGSR